MEYNITFSKEEIIKIGKDNWDFVIKVMNLYPNDPILDEIFNQHYLCQFDFEKFNKLNSKCQNLLLKYNGYLMKYINNPTEEQEDSCLFHFLNILPKYVYFILQYIKKPRIKTLLAIIKDNAEVLNGQLEYCKIFKKLSQKIQEEIIKMDYTLIIKIYNLHPKLKEKYSNLLNISDIGII